MSFCLCLSTQLLMEIKKVNFTVNNTQIYFDANGDPSLGYDIVYWSMAESNQGTRIKTIGEYWPGGAIEIPPDLVSEKVNVTVRSNLHHIFISPSNEQL